MEIIASESLVLTLSKEVEHLTSYQCIAIERAINSISPILKQRIREPPLSMYGCVGAKWLRGYDDRPQAEPSLP